MVAILVNRSITIQDGQKQKARQGKEKIMNKGNFLKICSREIFLLTGGSQKKKHALRRNCSSSLQEVLFWDNINYVLVGLIFNMSVKIIPSY